MLHVQSSRDPPHQGAWAQSVATAAVPASHARLSRPELCELLLNLWAAAWMHGLDRAAARVHLAAPKAAQLA